MAVQIAGSDTDGLLSIKPTTIVTMFVRVMVNNISRVHIPFVTLLIILIRLFLDKVQPSLLASSSMLGFGNFRRRNNKTAVDDFLVYLFL